MSEALRFPWMLLSTLEAYPSGTPLQEARATMWLDKALKTPVTPEAVQSQEWTISEILLALRRGREIINTLNLPPPSLFSSVNRAPRKIAASFDLCKSDA